MWWLLFDGGTSESADQDPLWFRPAQAKVDAIERRRTEHSPEMRAERRTIKIRGQHEDADRYYRCWHCGFVCDANRDQLGGEGHGATYGTVSVAGEDVTVNTGGSGCPNCHTLNWKKPR